MLKARRQKSAQAERAGVAHGEAGRDPVSDEAANPRRDTESTGSGLLQAALTRENPRQAWKRVKANKGAAGVDGLDIEQTARHCSGLILPDTLLSIFFELLSSHISRGNMHFA